MMRRTISGTKAFIGNIFGAKLRANEPISTIKGIEGNSIANFVDDHKYALGVADVFKTYGTTKMNLNQSVKEVFFGGRKNEMNLQNLDWAKAAASIPTTIAAGSAAAGAIRGVTTDSNGNTDIAGIPFI